MATVYRAEDVRHRRKVAVKVLRPDLGAVLGAERFLREIEVAARLTHPHIVPVYDSGEADGLLFYVRPLIGGESLRDRLAREGELPVADALRIMRQVTDALALAHRSGVVHRDIKPENVLLAAGHAMVADNVWAIDLPRSGTVSLAQAQPMTSGNQVIEAHDVSRDGRTIAYDTDVNGTRDTW